MKQRCTLLLFAVAFIHALTPVASAQSEKDPRPKQTGVFSEQIEVELVNVDVVVTDAKGKPVRGLKPEQFVLYEDGVPQTITNFEAVDRLMDSVKMEGEINTLTGEEPRDESLKVTIFIDNMSLHPATRNDVIDFATDFSAKIIEKGGQVMIISSVQAAEIRAPFTRDRGLIGKALKEISGELGGGIMNQAELRALQAEILGAINEQDALRTARQYAYKIKNDTERTVQAVRETLKILKPVEGRKAMVIVTDGLPIDPGSDVFRFVELAKAQTTSIAPFLRPEFSLSDLMKNLGESASAAGVALYPFHTRGMTGFGQMLADESFATTNMNNRWMGQEIPTEGPGGGFPVHRSNMQQGERATFSNSFVIEQEALLSSRTALELLASITGGFATVGSGDFRKAFEGITRDLDVYYALAYRRRSRDHKRHTILVEVPETKYRARFRKSFAATTPDETTRDLVTSALMLDGQPDNPLNVQLTVYPAAKDKKHWRVPIQIAVPMSAISPVQSGDYYEAKMRLFLRVSDSRKRMTQIGEKFASVRFPITSLEDVKGKFYVLQLDLVTEPGDFRVAAAALDESTTIAGATTEYFHAGDLKSR